MLRNECFCDCDAIHENLVKDAKSKLIDDDKLIQISDFYKAMSDSTRIKIINLLEKNELCVCDISVILNMTKSAVSHQLKNLREMNLIKCRRQGKEVWYTLSDDHVKQVFDISLQHILEAESEE
jgi:ArsR family transcriptional regulator, lead/cadmium/zinc/bismuth-responsive transcriptional repressor